MHRQFRQGLLAAVGAFAALVCAQPASAATPQITSPVNESVLATLAPDMHPNAVAANDRGRVADNMRIEDMMLLLHRGDAQEKAL